MSPFGALVSQSSSFALSAIEVLGGHVPAKGNDTLAPQLAAAVRAAPLLIDAAVAAAAASRTERGASATAESRRLLIALLTYSVGSHVPVVAVQEDVFAHAIARESHIGGVRVRVLTRSRANTSPRSDHGIVLQQRAQFWRASAWCAAARPSAVRERCRRHAHCVAEPAEQRRCRQGVCGVRQVTSLARLPWRSVLAGARVRAARVTSSPAVAVCNHICRRQGRHPLA